MKKISLVGVVNTIISLSVFAAEFFKHPAASRWQADWSASVPLAALFPLSRQPQPGRLRSSQLSCSWIRLASRHFEKA